MRGVSPSAPTLSPSRPRVRSAAVARPISAKIDGRSSALRALGAAETQVMAEAAIAYLERSPEYAAGMMHGFRLAKAALWAGRGAWTAFRALVPDDPRAA